MQRTILLAGVSLLALSFLVPTPTQAQVPAGEREALSALFNATGGPAWTHSEGWLGPVGTECSWYGVACDGGRVVELTLGENNLVGEVPGQLTGLSVLVNLDLSHNQLTGPVPGWPGAMLHLEGLWLNANQLSGPIPVELAQLPMLQYLNLGENRLTGPLPRDFARVTSLESLELYGNQLTGPIPPELGNLPSLLSLSLGGNQLSGHIPPELGNLATLEYLDLFGNQLEDGIPDQLANLVELRGLWLGANPLGGHLPTWLGNLIHLEGLSAEAAMLDGDVPPELGNLSNLRFLDLGANQLSGPIPGTLGNLVELRGLWLGGNLLSGPIPAELGNLSNLEDLWLAFNRLEGMIPPTLGNLAALRFLGLDVNQLQGEVPAELGNLAQLTELWLGGNQLEGFIPPELGNLSNLVVLWLSWNRLSGPVPAELGRLTNLTQLSLDSNRLVGELSASLANLTMLGEAGGLNLAWNGLYTRDELLVQFLDAHDPEGNFQLTQTVAPGDVTVAAVTTDSVTLTWTPIPFSWGPGGYLLLAATSPEGPYELAATTESKEVDQATIGGLAADTTYYFALVTVSAPNEDNPNTVQSDPGAVVSATTDSATSCSVSCTATVPAEAAVASEVSFQGSASAPYCSGELAFAWSFGDGSSSVEQSPTHGYDFAGTYSWSLRVTADGALCTRTGSISVRGAGTTCGNAACEPGETAWSCPDDCGFGTDETGRVGQAATRLVVPAAVGGQGGVGGTYWVSEAMVHNPGSDATDVTFHFVDDDQPGVTLDAGPVSMAGGAAVFYENFVEELFGVSSNGSVRVDSDHPVMLVSRTYNDQPDGTYGQFLGAVSTRRALGIGDRAYLVGLSEDDDFRSNVILQEVSGAQTDVLLTVYSGNGTSMGETTIPVPALAKTQDRLLNLGFSGLTNGYATVEVTTGGQVVALASVVDRVTGDAMTVDALHRTQAEMTSGRAASRRATTPPSSKTAQTVDFTWAPEIPLAGELVQFTDLSSSDVRSWSWRFGDDSTSSEQNPSHTYAEAGTYSVTLVVSSSAFGSAFRTRTVTVAEGPSGAAHYLLAVVARLPGTAGTTWRSDVWVMNPLEEVQTVWLEYHPVDAGDLQRTDLRVRPGEQVVLEDVVASVFPLAGDGKGALHVFAPQGVFVSSRTYSLAELGTFGQALPALAAGDLLAPGDSGRLLKLKSTSTMRCNIGFTEMDGLETEVRLELLAISSGTVTSLAAHTYSADPFENLQVNGVFQSLGLQGEYEQAFAVVEVSSGGRVYAYASNVDESTGDGELIPAIKE